MSSLTGAVEKAGPVSGLHGSGSFDPDDFAVPTGREEQWRFTPLRRIRGLHSDAALDLGKVTVEVDADTDITVVRSQHGDARIGTALVPSDRVSARAFAGFGEATIVTVPAGVAASRPTVINVVGASAEHGAAGHIVVEVEANASAVVVLQYVGSATLADNVEFLVGDGCSAECRVLAGLGGRLRALVAPCGHGGSGRYVLAYCGDSWRIGRSACAFGAVRGSWRQC